MSEQVAVPGHPDILLIKEFLNGDTCALLCEFAAKQKGSKVSVVGNKTGGAVSTYVDTEVRDTTYIPVDGVEDVVNEVVFNAIRDEIEPHFKTTIEWWEKCQLLAYGPGGKYHSHADSENYDVASQTWKKCLDRDISLLLYLNNAFTGGALTFKTQQISIQPNTGLLIAFPSDSRFEHSAEPVQSGSRFVLASWARIKDVPRVLNQPPYGVTYPERFAKKTVIRV